MNVRMKDAITSKETNRIYLQVPINRVHNFIFISKQFHNDTIIIHSRSVILKYYTSKYLGVLNFIILFILL